MRDSRRRAWCSGRTRESKAEILPWLFALESSVQAPARLLSSLNPQPRALGPWNFFRHLEPASAVSAGQALHSSSYSKSMIDYGPYESFACLSYQNNRIQELVKRNEFICSLGQNKRGKILSFSHLSCCSHTIYGGWGWGGGSGTARKRMSVDLAVR